MDPSWSKQSEFWDFCYSCWVLSSSESCQACERTERREPWLRTKPPTQRKAGDGQDEVTSFVQLDTAISEARWPRILRSHEPIKILFFVVHLFKLITIYWVNHSMNTLVLTAKMQGDALLGQMQNCLIHQFISHILFRDCFIVKENQGPLSAIMGRTSCGCMTLTL